jgi:hypothetical protein
MAQRHQRGWLKKEKRAQSVLKAKPGYCSSVLLDNLMANVWKTKSL